MIRRLLFLWHNGTIAVFLTFLLLCSAASIAFGDSFPLKYAGAAGKD